MLAVCAAAAGCRQSEDSAPAVATAALALSRARVSQGSPVEMTYRFQVAQTPDATGRYRVFVHIVDTDDEQMWTDDHELPSQPSTWQPGQTIEYQRTMFAPLYPYVGNAKVVLGIYNTETHARLKLSNTDRGDRSYEVASFELAPETENVYVVFKDGWHTAEQAPNNPSVEWRWTRKQATLAFRNPRRDSTLILQLDNPATSPNAASEADVRLGDRTLGVVRVGHEATVHHFEMAAADLGDDDMVELTIVANRSFVPASEPELENADQRELGVRVFHAFVQPKS